jgi:Mn-dependent DtxR family transcriptional regulator
MKEAPSANGAPAPNVAAPPELSSSDRRALVEELYPTCSQLEIARRLACSERTVSRDIHALRLTPRVSRRRLTLADNGYALRAALAERGITVNRFATEIGLDPSTVYRLISFAGVGVKRDTAHRISNALEKTVEQMGFVPALTTERATVVRVRPATPPAERYDGVHFREPAFRRKLGEESRARLERARVACESYCREHDLWTIERAAHELILSVASVYVFVHEGLLEVTEERSFGVGRRLLLRPRDVKRFARDRYRATDGRVRASFDRERMLTWALAHGWSSDRAKALADCAEQRERRYGRIRVDVGGRPREEEVRELLIAAGRRAVYRRCRQDALHELTYTQLCHEAGLALWADQVERDEYDWLPRIWANPRDTAELNRGYGENLTARVRRLVGPELKKLLQIARTKLAAG